MLVEVGVNPSKGVRAITHVRVCLYRVECSLGSFNLAGVGSLDAVTYRAGSMTRLGDLVKREAVKSSTMKGEQSLAGYPNQRRCQTKDRGLDRAAGLRKLRVLAKPSGFVK